PFFPSTTLFRSLFHGLPELRGEGALLVDEPQDLRLPLGQVPEVAEPVLEGPQGLLVQPARLLLPVAGEEGDGVPLIEKGDHPLHVTRGEVQLLAQLGQDGRREGVGLGGGPVASVHSSSLWPAAVVSPRREAGGLAGPARWSSPRLHQPLPEKGEAPRGASPRVSPASRPGSHASRPRGLRIGPLLGPPAPVAPPRSGPGGAGTRSARSCSAARRPPTSAGLRTPWDPAGAGRPSSGPTLSPQVSRVTQR